MPIVTQPRPQAGSFSSWPPGELGAGCVVPRAVAGIEEAFQRAEGDFAIRCAGEGEVRLFDEIEEVGVPYNHLGPRAGPGDAPAAGEGLRKGGNLGHQPASARSLGSRTRL